MKTIWKWIVPSYYSLSERADKAILEAYHNKEGELQPSDVSFPECSRSRLHKLMDLGHATLDKNPMKPSTKLVPGKTVQIEFPIPHALDLTPTDRPLVILFEDENIVVINKPAGLTVHPTPGQDQETLVHALLHHIKDLSGIGGVLRPGIVHRLDKDTSGAMVISKTDRAHQVLLKTFATHSIERRYWALCYQYLTPQSSIKIESLIGRNPSDRKKMSMNVKEGRKAITYARTLETYSRLKETPPFASWIEARLETGRTHQVRVHLTGRGCSIFGDPAYGTPTERQSKWTQLPQEIQTLVQLLKGQCLHARILGFKHPLSGQDLYFEATPPSHFQLLLDALQRYRLN